MKRILIVDDDPEFRDSIATLLEAKGYRVEQAEESETGFAMAVKTPPDLFILDVMMTRTTEGFDLARKLKHEPRTAKIPAIMISGIRHEMSLPFQIEPNDDWLPVVAFLEKPVKPDALLSAVEKQIGV